MANAAETSGRITYQDLVSASNDRLERLMLAGTLPDVRQLAGWEFRGYNSLPLTGTLGFRKFAKGFLAEPPPRDARDRIRGYNVKMVQGAVTDPWTPALSGGKPVRHGFFAVYPVDPAATDNLYPDALLLDYGQGGNPWYDPSAVLRDYLVQVAPDNPDLLLGKAYLALGSRRIPVSYFALERLPRA